MSDSIPKLPSGWKRIEFGEVCTIRNGYAFKSKDFVKVGIPLIKQGNLTGKEVDLNDCVFLPKSYLDEYSRFQVHRGDIIIGMSGSIGEPSVYLHSEPALQNQRTGLLQPTSALDILFSRHFLEYAHLQIVGRAKGMAIANVSAKDIEAIPLGLPPLNEQNRVVEKIETLFVHIDKGEEALREVQKLLKRYRQSILKAAVTGELTRDWREANKHKLEPASDLLDRLLESSRESWQGRGKYKEPQTPDVTNLPKLPEGWVWASLGGLGIWSGGGTPSKNHKAFWSNGTIPWVSPKDMKCDYIKTTENLITEEAVNNSSVRYIPENSLLMVTRSGILAHTFPVAVNECQVAVNQDLKTLTPHSGIRSEFLLWCLKAQNQRVLTRCAKHGTTVASIDTERLKRLPIPIPPTEEQRRVVDEIHRQLLDTRLLHDTCLMELNRSSNLRQSILKSAFTGQLVPQDPHDEPASELLARIRAERDAAPAKKRTKKKAVKKKARTKA
jgi:type I restriction enzyme S subunit